MAGVAILLFKVLYPFLSLPFTFFFQCLPHTDFLWNNWFSSPISWLAVFKVSYSVTLRPSTIPSWVSNGSPETSNGSLDEQQFPRLFILHLLTEPEVTFSSQKENLPQSFCISDLLKERQRTGCAGFEHELVVGKKCAYWPSVVLSLNKSVVYAIDLNYW